MNDVPPPSEEDASPPIWSRDEKATSEVKNWGDDVVLKGQRQKNELIHLRVYGFVVATAMVTFSALYVSALFIWTFHYIAPEAWGFLSDAQLSKVQSVLFSGSVGAVVSSVMTKHVGK